jgi:hypothetical protein
MGTATAAVRRMVNREAPNSAIFHSRSRVKSSGPTVSVPEPRRGLSPGRAAGGSVTLTQSLSTVVKVLHKVLQLFALLEQRVSNPDLQRAVG